MSRGLEKITPARESNIPFGQWHLVGVDQLSRHAEKPAEVVAPEPESRSFSEVASDTGHQLAKGVMTTAGAVPNLVAPEGDTAKLFNDASQFYDDQQSETMKALTAAASDKISRARQTGEWDAFTTALAEYSTSPALFSKLVMENAASLIPGLGMAKGAQVLAKGAALARGAQTARAAQLGATAGTVAGGATNSLLNGGGARQEAFSDWKQTLMANGMSEDEATQTAIEKSRVAAGIGMAAGAVSGATGLERGVVGALTKGGVKGFATGTASEFGGEMLEELAPKAATNVQIQSADPARAWNSGLGETAAQTMVASSPGAVLSGAAHARRTADEIGGAAPTISEGTAVQPYDPVAPERPADGLSGEFIPAGAAPALPSMSGAGATYDQQSQALPPGQTQITGPQPMEGDVLAPESLPPGQALLPAPPIDGESRQDVSLPRQMLPPPTERQSATARGLLNHSPRPSPELLQRLMRIDADRAAQLFQHWQQKNAPTTPADAGVSAAPQVGAGETATDAPIVNQALDNTPADRQPRALPRDSATRTATQLTRQGFPSKVIPHPTQPGMFAVIDEAEALPAITAQDVQAHAAATSPYNATPQPTEAQKQAGNYRKGHIKFDGLDISIENPAGSKRTGKGADGKAWQTDMQHHYGYLKGTLGADKDHLDVFIKPGMEGSASAYVIDQIDPKTGKFDEHKIILGAGTEQEAKAIYHANYQQGWQGMGEITAMPMADFKTWIKSGNTTKPLAYQAPKEVRTAQRKTPSASSLLQAIVNRGGINREIMSDVGADPAARYMPGLFTAGGTSDLSSLAQYLFDEDGFHQIPQNSDVGPARELEELIARAITGEKILSTAAMEKAAQAEEDAKLKADAKQAGIKIVARKFSDIKRDYLLYKDKQMQALIERLGEKFARTLEVAQRVLASDTVDSAIDAVGEKASAPDFYQDGRKNLVKEMLNARRAQRTDGRGTGGVRRTDQDSGNAGRRSAHDDDGLTASPGNAAAQGSVERPGFKLDQQTEAQARAADEKRRADEAQRLKDDQAAENKRKADAERSSFSLTGSDRPADVLAAQGQQDIFSQPTSPSTASIQGKKFADMDAAQLRRIADGKSYGDEARSNARAEIARREKVGTGKAYKVGDLVKFSIPHASGKPTAVAGFITKLNADGTLEVKSQLHGYHTIKVSELSGMQVGADKTRTVNTEDAGEELSYNLRNRRTAGLKWDEIKDQEAALRVKEVTKAKVYPKPDYAALAGNDQMGSKVIAHLIKQVYDSIAPVPATGRTAPTDEQLRQYIEAINRVMDDAIAWAKDAVFVSTYRAASNGKPLMEAIYPSGWRDSRAEALLLGGNKFLSALQPGYDEVKRADKDIGKGWPAKREAWQTQGFKVLETAESVQVRPTNVDGKYYLAIDGHYSQAFPTEAEASAALDKLQPWLLLNKNGRMVSQHASGDAATEAAREATKRGGKEAGVSDKGIKVTAAQRIGVSHRAEGENVTSDRLVEAFGFKGINFGTWMKGKGNEVERQLHLNHAYDSFMDLADIMGVPPKAMSLNGMLGIAFGAQGRAGAAAHFVPGVNEINLTRESGAGSLGHEFAHALDHYFARRGGLDRQSEPFLTEHVGKPAQGELRPEVLAKFKAIVAAMNKRPLTPEEHAKQDADYTNRLKYNVDSWLKSIRRGFESATIPKASQADSAVRREKTLTKFDEIAGRIKALNVGDGLIQLSSTKAVYPAVAELRELHKEAFGRTMALDDSMALQSNVQSLKYQESKRDGERSHEPQSTSTDFARNAAKLDKEKGGKPYWNTNLEKFARAFDAFLTDTLAERAAKNSYLSHSGRIGDTVPSGTEREAINATFRDLIDTIQTKETNKGIALESRAADTDLSLAANVLIELADQDELFRYPVSKSSNLKTVFADVYPDAKYFGEHTREDERTETEADHRHVFINHNQKRFYVYSTDDKRVWIDVSSLKPGDSGSRIYAAVANWAHNTGLRFVGDPLSVSEDAIKARTRMMLSSALRFGTTKHLEAAREQIKGIPDKGIEPLNWSGNDLEKLQNLIHTFVTTTYRLYPELNAWKFDFRTGTFARTGTARADSGVQADGDRGMEPEHDGAGAGSGILATRAGSATGRLAVLAKSLVSREGREIGDEGILQAVLDRARTLAQGSLKALLSKTTPADAGVSASGTLKSVRDQLVIDFGEQAIAALEHKGILKILATANDLPPGLTISAKGTAIFDGDTAYLIADRINPLYAKRELLHEVGEHYGLKAMLGDKGYATLGRRIRMMKGAGNVRLKEAFAFVRTAYPELAEDSEEFTHEVLANVGQDASIQARPWWQEIIAAVKRWLVSKGFTAGISEGDIQDMVLHSLKAAARGDSRNQDAASHEKLESRRAPSKGFDLADETRVDAFRRTEQDSVIRWEKVQDQIAEQGGTVGVYENVYDAMKRYPGRAAEAISRLSRDKVEPLLKRAATLKASLEELGTYLYALHAKERNAYISGIRDDMPANGSGLSNGEADMILADYRAHRADFAQFDALARDFQALTAEKQALLVKNGVLSQDQADAMTQAMGAMYVPLKGFERIDESGQRQGNGTGNGYSTGKKLDKRAYGRVSRAGNIVENIIRDFERAILVSEKAVVGKYVRRLAEANPDASLWTVDQPEKKPQMGSNGKVVLMPSQMLDQEGEIQFIENGKPVRIQLHDPLLARAYNNLGAEQLSGLLKVSAHLNAMLRQFWTAKNPSFFLINPFRDAQTAPITVTGEEGALFALKALTKLPVALWSSWAHERNNAAGLSPEWKDVLSVYGASGARTGPAFVDAIESKALKLQAQMAKHGSIFQEYRTYGIRSATRLTAAKAIDNPFWDLIEHLNGAFENMTRLAVFKAYLDQNGGLKGLTGKNRAEVIARASKLAKNCTVDFNTRGEKSADRNALYLFWNASVQGSTNVIKSLTTARHRNQVRAIVGSLVAAGFVLGMLADDDDDLIADHIKERNLAFRLKDMLFKLPLTYGYSAFIDLGRLLADVSLGRKDSLKASLYMMSSLLANFSPLGDFVHGGEGEFGDFALSFVPTVLKPGVMVGFNRGPFGNQVMPEYSGDENKPDREKMFRSTRGSVYDWMANGPLQWADVSPESIKLWVSYIFGGTGRTIADALSTGKGLGEGGFDIEKVPVVNKFVSTVDVEEHRGRFYDQIHEADKAYDRYRSLLKSDPKAAGIYLKENRQAVEIGNSARARMKLMKLMRDKEDAARNDKDTAGVQAWEAKQIQFAKDLNARVKAKPVSKSRTPGLERVPTN
jgi:hypothetical protein